MSNLRILYIVHQFFPEWYTGTERFVLDLAKQIQRMGHYVEVLTYFHETAEGLTGQEGVLEQAYQYQNIPVMAVQHQFVPEFRDFKIFEESIRPGLKETISKDRFDLIHVAHPMRLGYATRLAKNAGLPIVLTLTDFWLMCPQFIAVTSDGRLCQDSNQGMKCGKECYPHLGEEKLVKRHNDAIELFGSVDRVVFATNFLKQMFELNGFSSQSHQIAFGQDYHKLQSNSKKYTKNSKITLGYMSTVIHHKGAHLLINAVKKSKRKNIYLKIYGSHFSNQDYFEKLQKLAKGNKRIQFCGKYNYEDMSGIYNDIDILVVPSIWWENSPLVLVSALSHNVPAIVSDLGGMSEVIENGKNGFTFDPGNVNSLTDLIIRLSKKPTILNKLKENIIPPARLEEEAFEYEKIYLELTR
ncbi:glycosyltransferase family 4 protein [Candidatus Altiarchaeota archaeon]